VWELTAGFTIYAVTLLATILIAGSLSDHVGRRAVLIAALALMIVASVLFLVADNIGTVILARAIQGVATGAATSTFTAAIIELAPERHRRIMTVVTGSAPVAGLALGALATGLMLDIVEDPTTIVYSVLGAGFVVGLIAVLAARETAALSPGALASLRPRLAIPPAAKQWFVSLAPLVAAGWMFSGLFLGLAPSFDREVFGISDGALNGVIVALQPASAAVFSLLFSRIQAEWSARAGAALMLVGALLAITGIVSGEIFVTALGAIVGGAGQGAGFGASLRILAPLVSNAHRGGLFSAVYFIAYTSYGLPVLAAGLASNLVALTPIVIAYGAVVAGFALWAVLSTAASSRRERRAVNRERS